MLSSQLLLGPLMHRSAYLIELVDRRIFGFIRNNEVAVGLSLGWRDCLTNCVHTMSLLSAPGSGFSIRREASISICDHTRATPSKYLWDSLIFYTCNLSRWVAVFHGSASLPPRAFIIWSASITRRSFSQATTQQ